MLGMYRNGNYVVKLYEDGTKIRENNLNNLTPEFPESIDITITKKCDGGCKYCYENCTENGKHGDILNEEFINTLHPYTELALNGNDLSHPDLVKFLKLMKQKHIIVNMTVNQKHFERNIPVLKWLCDEKYIHGLGISYTHQSIYLIKNLGKFENAVVHVIAGILTEDDYNYLKKFVTKLLILGYKNKGRGNKYYELNKLTIDKNIEWLSNNINTNSFDYVCFDNLALEQLNIKNKVSKDVWDKYYMGDDGKYTMYIDMVNKKFAKSSMSNKQYDLLDNIEDMFEVVRNAN